VADEVKEVKKFKNVYDKLLHVQSQIKAPKNQYNKFGEYNYRSCEDIQEGAKPLLKEVRAILIVGDEIVQIGERIYIKATATFIDCDSEKSISNIAYAREELTKPKMDVSQVTGSASSYARKYALNGLFALDDVKDADTQDNSKQNENKNSSNTKPSNKVDRNKLITDFEAEIARTGKSLKWFLDQAGTTEVKYMKNAKLEEFVVMLKKLPNKASQ
jgi:hypothetical protein